MPRFYFDIASPYAYLAATRIGEVLPDAEWEPILLGGLFKANGRHSWLFDDDREQRIAELSARAEAYGLPPFTWWGSIPKSWLTVMRACTVAKREGRGPEFALACFKAVHAHGRELWHDEELAQMAPHAEMEPDALMAATQDPEIKAALRAATDGAHELGVPGVPTVLVGDELFWGDDRLEDAAAASSV